MSIIKVITLICHSRLSMQVMMLAAILAFPVNNREVNASIRNTFSREETQSAIGIIIQDENATGNDYYVSTAGNDQNNGLSPNTPWKTIARVNAFVFSPGDRVFFRRGDEWRESLQIDESGTAGAMITFSAYGTGSRPVFNGADFITGWSNAGNNVWTANCPVIDNSNGIPNDYIAILNGELLTQVGSLSAITSAGTYYIDTNPTPDRIYIFSTVDPDSRVVEVSARKFGVGVVDQAYIRLQSLDLRNTGHSGAFFHAQTETGKVEGNCIIEDCNFYRNRISGLLFDNGYCNNLVQNCTSTFNGNGFYCSSYLSWGSDRNTFSHCYSANNINYTTGVISDGHGYGIWNSDDNIVEHCESSNDTYGINIDPNDRRNDITIRYNYVHDTKQGTPGINAGGNIPAGTVHYIYGNLVVNPGAGADGYAIWVFGTSRQGSVFIINNTIFLDGSTNHSNFALYSVAGTNVTIKNNIVFSNSSNTTLLNVNLNSSFVCDNNLYYAPSDQTNILRYNGRNYHTLSEWQTATGLDIHSKYGDPLFTNYTNNWTLRAESPAIDAGAYVDIIYDFLKNPIVGAPDIGAFEFQPVISVPEPVYLSSAVENISPTVIEMNYSLTLANIVPPVTAFAVRVNSVSRAVSTVSVSGTKVMLTLASPVIYGDAVTVAY
ncbi:MAG TPA: SwmB domain-containing protein, partial [Bacteroidales bacterium]|nr:SwmB domain-containing protein [Bacteroidales bacterium]